MNFFKSFNLSELSWNITSQSQYLNFCQWWDRSELFCTTLLSIIFNCLLSIIEIKMIFWQLIENLAESSSKSVFTFVSQLLYWAIMLLYVSFDISDVLILMLLWSERDAEQSKLLFSIAEIMNSLEVSNLLLSLLNMLFHLISSREVLCCFIKSWWEILKFQSIIFLFQSELKFLFIYKSSLFNFWIN